MIAQKFRFHGHGSLNYVFKNGEIERSRFFAAKSTPNGRRKYPRLSIVVSKKVFKSAVRRNRIRRRLYNLIRPHLTNSPAIDIVITVFSPEVLTASHEEISKQLLPILKSSGVKSQKIH